MPTRDDDQAELDPREQSEPDAAENGATGTRPCPRCRAPVYEEAERCPYCGGSLGRAAYSFSRPWWFVAAAILALAIAILWALWD